MLKRYTFWLWMAVAFMFLTAAIHAIGLFVNPPPQSEVERQLVELMRNYQIDAGGRFHPTMKSLFTALSSCFSLLCLLGGLMNAYLLKKKVGAAIMKGVVLIDLLVFGACFVIMLVFTFLPPIVLTGLIALSLILATITVFGSAAMSDAKVTAD